MMPSSDEITKIAEVFSISVKRIMAETEIKGSPERTDFRCVVEDSSGHEYILEKFGISKAEQKNRTAITVQKLHKAGLVKTIPYIAMQSGGFTYIENKTAWQASEFVRSDNLPRPDYVIHPEIGSEFAGFLGDLSETALKIFKYDNSIKVFSIKKYIIDTFRHIEIYNPEIRIKIKPVFIFLKNAFFQVHDTLKTGFCHGDIHPMNVIWKGLKIKAVIDWEFMGFKPEIYDLANLLGCIGIEDPNALGGNLVKTLINDLKKRDIYENTSWQMLPEFLIAVRFGWLSEWLRKNDTEMIELETDFMNLLVDYCNDIKSDWNAIMGDN